MEILNYTEEHRTFRQAARQFFAERVTPHVEAWEEAGIVPREIWQEMGARGFLCTEVPETYGGLGGDFLYSVILTEELALTGCTGLAAPLHSDVVVPYICAYAGEDLKRRYLPGCVSGDTVTAIAMTEPNAGSDLASMGTTTTVDGTDVVINGQKTFISNGELCDLLVLAARDPAVENPYQGIDLYLVESGAPGFEKGPRLRKMGWHSQDTAELYFADCRIPQSHRLGRKGDGFLMLMEKLQQERLICAIIAVASAEVILEHTIRYAREAKDFGRSLTRSQDVQFALVDMATEVKLGRTFLDKAIAEHMEGKSIVVEASMAKAWTTDMAMRVADGCLDLAGQEGLCGPNLMARAWRDARVMSIFAGTNEIMRGIAAKFMNL